MHYEYEDVNRYRRRNVDPRTYWMQLQERPGSNRNTGGPTAPSTPSAPARSTAPTAPTAPSTPNAPTTPAAPTPQTAPTAPTVPPVPGTPAAPTEPTAPSAPSLSDLVDIELPELPSSSSSTISSVIDNCMDGMVFVWLKDGSKFWMVPKSSTSDAVSGYVWDGDTGWSEDEVSFSDISSVTCVAS